MCPDPDRLRMDETLGFWIPSLVRYTLPVKEPSIWNQNGVRWYVRIPHLELPILGFIRWGTVRRTHPQGPLLKKHDCNAQASQFHEAEIQNQYILNTHACQNHLSCHHFGILKTRDVHKGLIDGNRIRNSFMG